MKQLKKEKRKEEVLNCCHKNRIYAQEVNLLAAKPDDLS